MVLAARRFFKNDQNAEKSFVEKAKSHLSYSWNTAEAVQNSDVVIEAINENLEEKQALFVNIEKVRAITKGKDSFIRSFI